MPLAGNPYHFGSPVESPHFTDRVQELARLRALMLNGQNLVLVSPRRYGKSSLLTKAAREVGELGGRTGRISLMRCASQKDVAEVLLKGVLDGPLGWLHGHTAELMQLLKRIRLNPQAGIDPGAPSGLSVSFGAHLADLPWQDAISDIIHLLGEAGDGDHPVTLILDEFQKAYEINPNIPDLMKDLVDELPAVSFVFAGSKRHLMGAMVNDPDQGALYNIGHKLYLDRIPMTEFVDYLMRRAEAGGKQLQLAEATEIYERAMGVPNDVQLLAFWAYESADTRIDGAAVSRALRIAVGDSKAEFEARFDGLGLSQQRLLKLIAKRPLEHLKGQVVQAELGVSHTSVAKAADALVKTELIEMKDGRWRVASGLLREWLVGDLE